MTDRGRMERDQESSDDDEDMSLWFKDAATQVEEGDIVFDTVRTGVAETPAVVNDAQVFGTACLNTEPQTTFVLPSMTSILDHRTTIAETDVVEEGDIVFDTVRTGVAETPAVVNDAQVFGTACLNTEPQTTFVLPSMKSILDHGTTIAETNVVEEGDIVFDAVRTGVAETPAVVNDAQVFGTACLNTEPQTTFVLPSMTSILDHRTTIAETDVVEEGDIVFDAVRTGVAETPAVVNNAQVFGTACLNTEPQTTFVLPSMTSILDHRTTIAETNVVEEGDIVFGAVRTGVAETPAVVNDAQVFGTAFLNTEPQTTFVLPSMTSILDHGTTIAETDVRSDDYTVVRSRAGFNPGDESRVANIAFTNNPRSNSRRMSSFTSQPSLSLPYSSSLSSRPVFTRYTTPHFRSKTVPITLYQASLQTAQSRLYTSIHLPGRPDEAMRLTNHSSLSGATRTIVCDTPANIAGSALPRCAPVVSVVSGVSSQVRRQSGSLSLPLFAPRPSVQSDVPITRTTQSPGCLSDYSHTMNASSTREPGSELQTIARLSRGNTVVSERMSREARRICDMQYMSATRDSTDDVTPRFGQIGTQDTRIEPHVASRDSVQSSAHEQYTRPLAEQESHPDTNTDENPLTHRRASSAPSVGLEFFDRLFRRALSGNTGPEHVDVGLPLKKSGLETNNCGMQTEGKTSERARPGVCTKRRKSSLGIGTQRKRKSVVFMNDGDSRLRDKLRHRIWDGTTFKVEEVNDIDFAETALSRRGSRRESMGIVGNVSSPGSPCRRRHSTGPYNLSEAIRDGGGNGQTGSLAPDVVPRQQQSSGTEFQEQQSSETKFWEQQSLGTKFREQQSLETKFREQQLLGTKFREQQLSGTEFQEQQSLGTKFQEQQLSGTEFQEQQSSETKFWKQQSLGTKFQEQQSSETKLGEQNSVERRETSNQASSSHWAERRSANDFAGEPSHAQNEPTLESAGSESSTRSVREDEEEEREQYDMYS